MKLQLIPTENKQPSSLKRPTDNVVYISNHSLLQSCNKIKNKLFGANVRISGVKASGTVVYNVL